MPISALLGENILEKSAQMAWFDGEPLMQILDSAPLHKRRESHFILPVQFVNRPNLDYRAFCGNIESGEINIGDKITALPSNKTSTIKAIISQEIANLNCKDFGESALFATKSAQYPQSVSLVLNDEIDITRGDVIVGENHNLKLANALLCDIVWMSEMPLEMQASYIIKRASANLKGSVERILFKKDVNDFSEIEVPTLALNDIARCVVRLDREIAICSYENNRAVGSFIIIDKYTNATLGAGMIIDAIKDSAIFVQDSRVYSEAEKALNAYVREFYPEWKCREV